MKECACQLTSIDFRNENYVLGISIETSSEYNEFEFSLLIKERQTDRTKVLNLTKHKILNDGFLVNEEVFQQKYQTIISKENFESLIMEGQCWDFYVVATRDEEQVRWRLKSHLYDLEFWYYVDQKNRKMIVPYATKKRNVSFRIDDIGIIAKVEKVSLDKTGYFRLEGFAFNPDQLNESYQPKKKMILQNKDGDFQKSLPVQTVERPDLAEKYGRPHVNFNQAGFLVEGNINDLFSVSDDTVKVKATIEFDYDGVSVSSGYLKYPCLDRPFKPVEQILNFDGQKKKVRISRTKKAKYLFIHFYDYFFILEIKKKIRKKYIRLRRDRRTRKIYQKLFKLAGHSPADRKLVMFESFLGKQYSDNPRAIYEYMKEHYPEFKMVWSADKRYLQVFEEKNIPHIRRFTLKWLFAMARAKYWVTNSRMPLWIPKPKHTVYLQTWHGTPLKRLAGDMEEVHMPGTSTEKYKQNFWKEAGKWDYLVSPNAYSTEIFRRAFNFHKEIIESGYPRNDFLYNSNNAETIQAIKEKHALPLDKKVILYAPTWRDNQFYGKGRYRFDLELDLNQMREALGDEYIIILRMHYLVAENLDLSAYEGFAYDFSKHEDIRKLYLIADLLITDYSSVFFDYANLRRPMIFYVYDIEEYRDKLRGFYFDFEKNAPGPLVKTTDEVINAIKNLDNNGYQLPPVFETFYDRFCYLECGESSRRVVERVFGAKK